MNLRFRACLDARDKFYGFLGLSDQRDKFIPPDYSKTVQEVYETAALQMVWESKSFEIFSYVEAKSSTEGFSSWVPQWLTYSSVVSKEYESLQGRLGWSQHYQASKIAFFFVPLTPGKVGVQGIKIDRIRDIGASPTSHFTDDNFEVFSKWNQSSGAAEHPEVKYINQTTSMQDAFWLTLVNGIMTHPNLPAGVRASASIHRSWFLEWWAFYQSSSSTEPSITLLAFDTSVTLATFGRRFFTTEKGYIGTGPNSLQRGDMVVILDGGRRLYILRRTEGSFEANGDQFPKKKNIIIGDAYLHSLVDGEGEALAQRDGIAKQQYVLV